ncbi:cell envelope integrity protein TolA, partial [Pseudoroseomonas ludipueritiae]
PPQQAERTPPTPPQQQASAAPPAPPRPDSRPSQTPPAPEPSKQAGTGRTPPVQRPAEQSNSVQNTLERLRAAQAQQEAPRARASSPAGRPAAGGGAPNGNAMLSQGEIRGVADRISECWSVDAGMMGLDQIVVLLQVDMDPSGTIRNVRAPSGVPSDPRARAVFESARRALLDPKCSPLPIPREKIQAINNSTFRFNPKGLVR